jgi:hypothetical protein
MLEHHSHIRIEAKRAAPDAIASQAYPDAFDANGAQNWAQSPNKEKSIPSV